MSDDDTKIRERIRRMLALAEDESTTEGEREVALGRAMDLMAKHRIDRGMIDESGHVRAKFGKRVIIFTNPYSHEKLMLLVSVAHGMGCRLTQHTYGRVATRATVYAYESDLDLVDMLYTSLLLQQATALAQAARPTHLRGSEITTWKRSFLTSYAGVIYRRLLAIEAAKVAERDQAQRDSGVGAALVMADRKAAVNEFYTSENEGIKMARPRKLSHDAHGWAIGSDAGRRADLGGGAKLAGKSAAQLH